MERWNLVFFTLLLILLCLNVVCCNKQEVEQGFLCDSLPVSQNAEIRYDSIVQKLKAKRITSKSTDFLNDSLLSNSLTKRILKIRVVDVKSSWSEHDLSEKQINDILSILNESFQETNFEFVLYSSELLEYDRTLEDLKSDRWIEYTIFKDLHENKGMINLFIFDNNEYCTISDGVRTCSRTGGFADAFHNNTFSIFISEFDALNRKILPHEFGHFFGLKHTFYNAEDVDLRELVSHYLDADLGSKYGDKIFDTPADPNNEIYVDYSDCEMKWNYENMTGMPYKPLINNYMNYYKPCYLKSFAFTQGQILVMNEYAQMYFKNQIEQ